MENASKALIIAGSILVSIVIITLGVMIVNNVTGLVRSSSDMSEQEVATFNAKFENYEGTHVSGSNVRALYNAIVANNRQQTDTSLMVEIQWDAEAPEGGVYAALDKEPTFTTKASDIKVGKAYIVSFGRDSGSNRITCCYIKEIK